MINIWIRTDSGVTKLDKAKDAMQALVLLGEYRRAYQRGNWIVWAGKKQDEPRKP